MSSKNLISDVTVISRQEESPCHNIIFNLQIIAKTYDYEGEDVISAFNKQMDEFNKLSPEEQIKRFYKILKENSTVDEIECQHQVDFHHLLTTILTLNKK